MTDITDPIKALIDLGPELLRIEKLGALEDVYFENVESSPRYVSATQLKTILAAIEALTPIAEGTSVVEKVRKILEEIESETNPATRRFHGNGYSASLAHDRAKSALAAIGER